METPQYRPPTAFLFRSPRGNKSSEPALQLLFPPLSCFLVLASCFDQQANLISSPDHASSLTMGTFLLLFVCLGEETQLFLQLHKVEALSFCKRDDLTFHKTAFPAALGILLCAKLCDLFSLWDRLWSANWVSAHCSVQFAFPADVIHRFLACVFITPVLAGIKSSR